MQSAHILRGEERIKIVVTFCVRIEERFAGNVVCVLESRAAGRQEVASLISMTQASRIIGTQ